MDVQKGPKQHKADCHHWKFSAEMASLKATKKWVRSKSDPPLGAYPNTYSKEFVPSHTRKLLLQILNLCLKSGDIPNFEKLCVVSALPKAEGQVYTLDTMRPITVGPAISRFFHKIIAFRLSTAFTRHGIMDQAQFAFLPGKDIHGPIGAVFDCYRDRKRHGKNCYAIFYDISKAYDTVKWSSISRAMNRLGLPISFINLVMNVLRGTSLVMRTNRTGRVTPVVTVHQSIKQGCPLAPLLFTIVMDELHTKLRELGGYTMQSTRGTLPPHTMHSLGYCDDTAIFATSIEDLEKMNRLVFEFFKENNFQVNLVKTKVTGRSGEGEAFAGRVHWPGSAVPFTTVPPQETIKYLGAHISLDLNWEPQIAKMRSTILHTAACLHVRRLTLYQGCLLTKYVNGPKLEIGMRHATISAEELLGWDRKLSAALTGAANLSAASIHFTATSSICKYTPLSDLYLQAQAIQTRPAHQTV